MEKIMVIGCPGAGKSTFARALRDHLKLPLYYLDMLWHNPDQTTVSNEVFDDQLKELIQKKNWIIDGNYLRTLDMRMQACDTIFFLDYPLDLCLAGASARIGTKREDMPWIETTFDEDFKQWILDFPKNQLPQIYRLIAKYQATKQIIIFKSREETDAYLAEMK